MSIYGSYSSSIGSNNNNMSEIKVRDKEQPLDTVSMIVWDPFMQDGYGFIAASWDGKIRYYHLNGREEINNAWEFFVEHPILCCDMGPNNVCFVGLASGDILAISIQSSQTVHLGNHDAPICGIFWINQFNTLMTLGYDNLIKFWSLQQNSNNNYFQTEFKLPRKTHTASYDFPYLLIGSADSTIAIINMKDLPKLDIPALYEKTGIEKFSKFICSRIIGPAKKAILGTYDGRAINFQFKDSNYGIKFESPFVTRTQKSNSIPGSRSTLYGQTNTVDLGIHNHQMFGIIGGTEDLNIYNMNKKTRSKTITASTNYVGATTASRITKDNRYLAYATGQDWVKGIGDLENPKKIRICVVSFKPADLREFVIKS